MRKASIERVEAEHLSARQPDFHIGDTVDIGVRIMEGDKERVQVFTGTVIARRGGGATQTFTARRIVAGEGVERTFPFHSPHLAFIRIIRSGKVRRAKLYYLRDRVGKATRLTETRRQVGSARRREAEPTAHEEGDAPSETEETPQETAQE